MEELSQRLGAVQRLIEQAPDGAMGMLASALTSGVDDAESAALIQTLVSTEALERRTRAAVLEPLLPFCDPSERGMRRVAFPVSAPALTWRGLKTAHPDGVAVALEAFAAHVGGDSPPLVYDQLCLRAAEGLRTDAEPFRPLAKSLTALDPKALQLFADGLALMPLARRAIRRLPSRMRPIGDEQAAALKLAFRDAASIGEETAPLFMEILMSRLETPTEVLRLISLVSDRAGDSYLAGSELASFGERLLDDLEQRIDDIRRFHAPDGRVAGERLAASVQTATSMVGEFERWIALRRDGPWGARIHAARGALAHAVEARLREVEAALDAALPTLPNMGSRRLRGPPRLTSDPEPEAVRKAEALLALLFQTRNSASHGGFGALRSRVLETIDPRLDHYVESLLDLLHAGGGGAPPERIRAYLEVAAEFVGLVRDPSAGAIVRRRIAAA